MASKQVTAGAQGMLPFELDSPLHGKVRGEKSLMDFPFFVLSKHAHMDVIDWKDGTVSIQIRPSARGVANMYDKRVLLYVASLMAQAIDAGEPIGTQIRFTAHDFFRVVGIDKPSSKDYAGLAHAFERLQGTQIQTNIVTGQREQRGYFSWLSEAHFDTERLSNGKERVQAIRVQPCEWLTRAILKDRRLYQYHPEYFELGPIECRLYELAHSQCEGDQVEFPLAELAKKIGSFAPASKTKQAIETIAKLNPLPEYTLEMREIVHPPKMRKNARGKVETIVVMKRRPKALPSGPLPSVVAA